MDKLQCEKLTCYAENIHRYENESKCETLMFVSNIDYKTYCANCTGNVDANIKEW